MLVLIIRLLVIAIPFFFRNPLTSIEFLLEANPNCPWWKTTALLISGITGHFPIQTLRATLISEIDDLPSFPER